MSFFRLAVEAIMDEKKRSTIWHRPATKLGWWAVGLALGYLALSIVNMAIIATRSSLPTSQNVGMINFGFIMLLLGLAAGIVALIAIRRSHERSWMVWLSLLPGIGVIFLFIGEFTFPH
jgi:hypothetical protein